MWLPKYNDVAHESSNTNDQLIIWWLPLCLYINEFHMNFNHTLRN